MAHNDEDGGSGGKKFWELSQELEEEPHRYEDATEDTVPDYTTHSGVGDDTTDGATEDDTTDGAAEDATTDDGGARADGSQPKRQRKYRRVRTPTRCHIGLACNTSYHFAASRTVFPRVSPYLCPGPFAPFGTRI